MKTLLLVAIVVAPAGASADEGELQLGVTPSAHALLRHDQLNWGVGGGVTASYGLTNLLAVEAHLDCSRLLSLHNPEFEAGQLYYDVSRCSAVPAVVARFGVRWILGVIAGLGYRFETQSQRDVVSDTQVLLQRLESVTAHEGIAQLGWRFEYRFLETFSVLAYGSGAVALLGANAESDLAFGITLTTYLYP